jgi:hypothetical protein
VILSVSLDNDEQKWKEDVGQNEMTWLQYRDGGFTGPIATIFGVKSIPHTYTIDADGVLHGRLLGGRQAKETAGARPGTAVTRKSYCPARRHRRQALMPQTMLPS